MTQRLDRQMDFLDAIEALKSVERRNRTIDRARRENSAEHSWHVALMAPVLAEHAAARRLFARLPDDQAAHFLALWREFDARATPKARFAAAIDALQPLANHVLTGDPDETPRPARRQVLARKEAIAAFPNLWERAVALVDLSVAHGLYDTEP